MIEMILIVMLALFGRMQGGWLNGKMPEFFRRLLRDFMPGLILAYFVTGWALSGWQLFLVITWSMVASWRGERHGVGWFKGWADTGRPPWTRKPMDSPDSWIPHSLAWLDEPWNPWLGLSARGFLWAVYWLPLAFIDIHFLTLLDAYMLVIPFVNWLGRFMPDLGDFANSPWTWSEVLRHPSVAMIVLWSV